MANVSSNNLTTLYSGGGVNVRPTSAYGNANVVSLLNAGTDGGNTVTNILANGNIIANGSIHSAFDITTDANISAVGNANLFGNLSAYNVTASNLLTSPDLIVNSTNVHIGRFSGENNQGDRSIAIGYGTGGNNQGDYSVAIGDVAGAVDQGQGAVAIGAGAGENYQGSNSIAIGRNAGYNDQPSNSIVLNATGSNLDPSTANTFTVKPVRNANTSNVMYYNNTTGEITYDLAGNLSSNYANYAGNVTISAQPNITSLGNLIDLRVENNNLHLGTNAGVTSQGAYSVALGYSAGKTTQGSNSIAIGTEAGVTTQGGNSIAIGTSAGKINTAPETVSIGTYAGWDSQKQGAIAIGTGAGLQLQGVNSIAIGVNAGNSSQANNSIILNATGSILNQTTANTFTVKPVRNANTSNVMFYNNTTGEITYDLASNAIVGNANYANFAGQVVDATQSNITTLGTLTNLSVSGNVFAPAIVQNASTYDTRVSLSSAAGIIEVTTNGNSTQFKPSGQISVSGAGQIVGGTFDGSGITLGGSQTDIFQNRGGNVTIQVGSGGTIANTWNFNNDGNLILPGNIFAVKYANGTTVNLDGPVANANYANYAGNVTISAQPNITSVGNLVSLTVSNSVGNTRSSIMTATPLGNSVGLTTTSNAFLSYTDYGLQSSNASPLNFTFIKARGNSASPTTAFNNDTVGRMTFNVYNGNTYPRVGSIFVTATNASSLPNSNVVWSGATLNFVSGNPNGNTTSTTATSNQNLFQLDQFGRIAVLPGGPGACVSIGVNNFGTNSDGSGGGTSFNFNRSRGNRDNLDVAVQNGDIVGGIAWNGYTGGSGVKFAAGLYANVNTAYGTIGTGVPTDVTLIATSNTANATTTFRGNGQVDFPGNIVASGNVFCSNVTINTSGFVKLASFTAAALTAITGSIGWMAAVNDSSSGGNPNGMLAFWDTTNNRWSYIHDNSAV